MTGAEVVNCQATLALYRFQGTDMSCRLVANMDVITHSGAVWGIVVVAKHAELLSLAHSHLGDVWHQVVWDSVRVLAYLTALVGSDWVEIAQEDDVPLRVCLLHIHQHFLQHRLGLTAWIGAMSLWTFLGDRNHGWVTVDGG